MSLATDLVIDTGVLIARELAKRPRTKVALSLATGVSVVTAQRSLMWLREVCSAPLAYDRRDLVWALEPGWRVPTEHLPCWALREELRELVGDVDPLEFIRQLKTVTAHLHGCARDLPKVP